MNCHLSVFSDYNQFIVSSSSSAERSDSWIYKRSGSLVSSEDRDLIFRMVSKNPTGGAPRIPGELLMLGFDVSRRRIARWIRKSPRGPELVNRWRLFCKTIEMPSRPWISSPSQQSHSICSTAFSSCAAVAVGSCNSTNRRHFVVLER
jgi:hypothetical protein